MSNISTPKGAGKGKPTPKSKTTEKTESADQIQVGDLVERTFDATLCQVITIDDQAVVVAPLLNFEDGERFKPHERTAVHLHEVRKIPSPVIKTNWQQMRTQRNPDAVPQSLNSDQLKNIRYDFVHQATTRRAIDAQSEQHERQGDPSHEVKLQHQKMLANVINAYEIAESLWEDLTEDGDVDDFTLAWWDHVHIANMGTLIQATRAELYDVFKSVSSSIAVDATLDERLTAKSLKRLALADADASEGKSTPRRSSALVPEPIQHAMRLALDLEAIRERFVLYHKAGGIHAGTPGESTSVENSIETAIGEVRTNVAAELFAEKPTAKQELLGEILAGLVTELPLPQEKSKK